MSKIIINGKDGGSLKAYKGGNEIAAMRAGDSLAYRKMETGSQPEPPAEPSYLCFTAEEVGTIVGMAHYRNNASSTRPVIYVSTDKASWTLWDYTQITLQNIGDKVYMYGDNPSGVCHGDYDYSRFWISGRAGASGDITTLITREGTTSLSGTNGTFSKLFQNCTALTTAPELPATTLAMKCYYHMFNGCTSLTTAPDLPAMTMLHACYFDMFGGCTALATAPSTLPATTLASQCYEHMFQGCTSLTTAPALPATNINRNTLSCYKSMFSGCTSLTSAPALPATTLANSCYLNMFQGCTSLTTPPALPATTLANGCYQNMFQNCKALTTAPELPATALAKQCYYEMFSGCTALTAAPSTLPATTLASQCYGLMFSGCTALTAAPSTLPATTLNEGCYSYMFQYCTSLTSAPALQATTLAFQCYFGMFYNCTSLTSAPAALPATSLADGCYMQMFYGCTSLTTAPALPATSLADSCYAQMFYGCTSLASAPAALPATSLADSCYMQMFYGCTSLTTAPELPATTLAPFCYNCMFNVCTSLTTAPELPATSIDAECCYQSMFSGCSSLEEITVSASQWNTESAAGWVYDVAASGIIHTPQDCDIPYPSTSGAPEGWTVDGGYTEAGNEIATDYVDVYVDPQGYSGDITFNGGFIDNTNGAYGNLTQVNYILDVFDSDGNMVLSNAYYIGPGEIYNGQFSINASGQMSFSDETWPPVTLTGTWHIIFDVDWENNFQTIEKNGTWECWC